MPPADNPPGGAGRKAAPTRRKPFGPAPPYKRPGSPLSSTDKLVLDVLADHAPGDKRE